MPDTTEGTPTTGATTATAATAAPLESPIAPVTSAAPQTPPASPSAPDTDTVRMTSAKLKERLDETATAAQRKLLKDLGFEKPEDMKGALARLKALEDEKLSAEERTQKQIKELQAAAEAVKPVTALAAEAVNELFAALPEEQQKAIDEEAQGDPAARLRLIKFARKLAPAVAPAPMSAAAQAVGAQAAPAAAPSPPSPAPPANTAPPPGAPRQSAVKTKYEQWQEKVAAGDRTADLFYSLNERAIRASAPPPAT